MLTLRVHPPVVGGAYQQITVFGTLFGEQIEEVGLSVSDADYSQPGFESVGLKAGASNQLL